MPITADDICCKVLFISSKFLHSVQNDICTKYKYNKKGSRINATALNIRVILIICGQNSRMKSHPSFQHRYP